MGRRRLPLHTILLSAWLVLVQRSETSAWEAFLRNTTDYLFDYADPVAVDSRGNVIAGGATDGFTVAKFTGDSGSEQWRYTADFGGYTAAAVAVDGADDVVATGGFSAFVVVKLDGRTGAEVWRYLAGAVAPYQGALAVAVDQSGDVFAGGATANGGNTNDFTVVKLAGATGTELWRTTINDGAAEALLLDTAGDVVAAGVIGSFAVIKLAGATGAEAWRHVIPDAGWAQAFALAFDPHTNTIAVAGSGYFNVVKVAGQTGDELWRQSISIPFNPQSAAAQTVIIDAAGDVVAAGFLPDDRQAVDFAVIKFAGVSGNEVWRAVLHGSGQSAGGSCCIYPADAASGVAVDASGDVLAGGILTNTSSYRDFFLVKLAKATGTEVWRRVLNGGRSGSYSGDQAGSVAVDGAGNVVVTGGNSAPSAGETASFVVEKLRPDGKAFSGGCSVVPQTVCREPTAAGRSPIRLKIGKTLDQQSASWRWGAGAATAASDFGNPQTATDYAVCVYDSTGGSPQLVLQAPAPAGGPCARGPCWSAAGTTGFKYSNQTPLLDGLFAVTLGAGSDGQATVRAKGKGANLALPATLGLTPPVIVQLQSSAGQCWGATYTSADVRTNTSTEFAAK